MVTWSMDYLAKFRPTLSGLPPVIMDHLNLRFFKPSFFQFGWYLLKLLPFCFQVRISQDCHWFSSFQDVPCIVKWSGYCTWNLDMADSSSTLTTKSPLQPLWSHCATFFSALWCEPMCDEPNKDWERDYDHLKQCCSC